MLVQIKNLTKAVIAFNKLGFTLTGLEEGIADVETREQEAEIKSLEKMNIISFFYIGEEAKSSDIVMPSEDVTEDIPEEHMQVKAEVEPEPIKKKRGGRKKGSKNKPKIAEVPKKRGGRKKGSKNKPKIVEVPKETPKENLEVSDSQKSLSPDNAEVERAAKAQLETERMGSEVIISTGQGQQKFTMQHTFAGEIPESEATRDSLEAMDKLEKQEKEEEEGIYSENDIVSNIKEDKLAPQDQMGRNAMVSKMGKPTETKMQTSVLPGSEEIKNQDPFIDRPKKEDAPKDTKSTKGKKTSKAAKIKKVSNEEDFIEIPGYTAPENGPLIDDNGNDDDVSDAFIEC